MYERQGRFVKTMRLDKYLATYAQMSRREAKKAVKQGRVTLDGEKAVREEDRISDGQEVSLDGVLLQAEEYVYYMLNKPAGVISATSDRTEKTVLDLIDTKGREIFPMGRLDKDTRGLLILTNDGALAHRLLSPRYHVEKTYEFRYEGQLLPDAVRLAAEGIDIGEKYPAKPALLELPDSPDCFARLTISEGKYHQVKRMVAKMGGYVTELRRVSFAGILLDETLQPGEYRSLTEEEVTCLRQHGMPAHKNTSVN